MLECLVILQYSVKIPTLPVLHLIMGKNVYVILDIMIIMEHVHYVSQHAHRFFHLGVPFYLHFWGYIQIFGGAMYPLTLHLVVQRK